MASEGIKNFAAILTAFAAFGGFGIALAGLLTWKQQIRWKDGRGLAIELIQSFQATKRAMYDFRRIGKLYVDESISAELQTQRANDFWKSVEDYLGEVDRMIGEFERRTIQARVMWRVDLSFAADEFRDLRHVLAGALKSTAAAGYPGVSGQMRQNHNSTSEHFFGILYGYTRDERSLGERLTTLEEEFEKSLPIGDLA